MANNRGSIEAYLKLNIKEFEKELKKAASDFQKTMGKGLSTKMSSSIPGIAAQNAKEFAKQLNQAAVYGNKLNYGLQNLGVTQGQFNRILADTRSSYSALGNTIPTVTKQISAATSSIMPGDAFAKQFNLGTRSLLTMSDQAMATTREFSQLSYGARVAGKAAVSAFPIEHIERSSVAQAAFNRQIIEAGSSFAGTGRSFLAAQTAMTGKWGIVNNAATKVRNTVGSIGTKISNATQALDNFGTGLLGIVGIMGSQQIYDFTVGVANTFQGYEQFWAKAYGEQTAQLYSQTVEMMQQKYYAQPLTSARTLQLLANTMPTTTSSSEIASLTPVVQAYINFFKKMKPEFASLAEIEGPQDIAAVFSGNTGEIRASPLAQPLKEIAALPDEQKMDALMKLFNDRGIMEFAAGLTEYDKELNKFNATLNEIGITVGTTLLPLFTGAMDVINDFVNSNKGLIQISIIGAGVISVLAAIGGVGGLALQGLQSGGYIVKGLARELGTLAAKAINAAGVNVVLKDATEDITASNVKWGSTMSNVGSKLKSIGSAMVSFLISPMGLAVIGITALVAAIIILGNKYGWFKTGIENANDALSKGKQVMDEAKTAQQEAQKEVDKWQTAVNNATPGTEEYATATKNLKDAKSDLADATETATTAENNYKDASETHKEIMEKYADSLERAKKAVIAYRVSTEELTPEEGKKLSADAEWASQLTDADKATITTTRNLDNLTESYNKAAEGSYNLSEGQRNLTGWLADFELDWTDSTGWLEQLQTGVGWTLGFPDQFFSALKTDLGNAFKNSGDIFTSDAQNSTKGIKDFFGGMFGTASGAGGAGKPSFQEDLKNLFDFSRFGIKWPKININTFLNPLKIVPNRVKGFFVRSFNGAKSTVSRGVNSVTSHFKSLPGRVTAALGGLWAAITTPFVGPLNYIKNFVTAAISLISSTFWRLVGDARSAWSSIENAVKNPVNTIINLVNRLRSALGLGNVAGGDITVNETSMTPQSSASLTLPIKSESLRNKVMAAIYKGQFAGAPNNLGGLFAGGDSTTNWTNVGRWKDTIIGGARSLAQNFLSQFGLDGVDITDPNKSMTDMFLATVNKIFSAFHYEFYYNSKYGVLGTFLNRGGNCWDMSSLLLTIARAFGLDGYMVQTTWNKIGHVRAWIQGLGNMDPTAFVQRGGWRSYPSAGPMPDVGLGEGEVHVHVHFHDKVYGLPDFENVVDESVKTSLETREKRRKRKKFGRRI
jgi:hypothetical protein